MRIQDFDSFSVDVEQAVLWQYQNSKNLRTLINDKQNWLSVNHQSFWLNWEENVFNLCTETPTVFGMVVWSIILNVSVYIPVGDESPTKPIWGFNAFLIDSLSDTSLLSVGMGVAGTGIPAGTVITAIVNSTTIKISNMPTSTGVQTLTFSVEQQCTSISGDPSLTVTDSSILSVGMDVAGTGIAGSTTIVGIVSPTIVTLSNNATSSGTNDIVFSLDENGTLSIPGLENDYKNFGTTLALNPGSGNFSTKSQFYALTIQQQQFLLRLRYFQLCNLGDINDINAFLDHLCTGNTIGYTGTIYVIDNLDMTITYVFTTTDFPPALFSVLNNLNIFPRPAGVARI